MSAHKWESVWALINCTLTRTWSATFCTLPSRMFATPSCFAISRRLLGLLWYCRVEVREITFKSAILESGSEFRPEYRQQSTHSLCRRCGFQTEALQCFSPIPKLDFGCASKGR